MLGVPALGRHDPRRPALSVLNAALGGGPSSRLFQQVREERGLAYSVYSSTATYADTGSLAIYAGCGPERLGEVASVVRGVLDDLGADGLTTTELARAQGNLGGGLVLGSEDVQSRMHRLGRSEIDHGRHRSLHESLERIAAVTREDVAAVARELLAGPVTAAVVGPFDDEAALPSSVRG
jgi:predicted Zn-dependent peptidase